MSQTRKTIQNQVFSEPIRQKCAWDRMNWQPFLVIPVDDKNGFLRPLDAKKWAYAIVMAADFTPEQRERFAQETLNRYSTDIIDANYLELMMALNTTNANECISVADVLKTSLG